MKVQILQEDLIKGLNIVTRAAATRGQLPVLGNILFQATKDGLVVAATNLELGLRASVGGKVSDEGATTVPAKTVTEFVASLSSGSLSLETDGEKLKVSNVSSSASFSGIPASEFPVLALTGQESKSLTISQKTLVGIATQVAYACASEESRPVLTGVQLKTSNGQFVATATDGFRMSQKKVEGVKTEIENLILPARTILEVAKLSEGNKEVEMTFMSENNQVVFKLENTEIYSRVLEGNFPDMTKIIPQEINTQVIVDREDFVKALRATSIFARENNNIVKFKIQAEKVTISAVASQLGENSSDIEGEVNGDGGEISFNYKFVMDFLNSTSDERIVFKMNSNTAPGIFALENDETLTHIIMPVRLQS